MTILPEKKLYTGLIQVSRRALKGIVTRDWTFNIVPEKKLYTGLIQVSRGVLKG